MRPWIKYEPTTQIDKIEYHRLLIENKACPKCKNLNLKVLSLQEGAKGWQAKAQCNRCLSMLTLNDTGFEVNFNEGTK